MSKNKNKFRFCVGSSNEFRSNIWTVSQSKDDVYMISRSFGKDFKVSLHGSGVNQAAVTEVFLTKHDIAETERPSNRWYYDSKDSTPKIVFAVCFLSNQLIDFTDIDEIDCELISIPPPEYNYYVEVLVYKSLEKPLSECIIPAGYSIFEHKILSNGLMLVFMYHYPELLAEHDKIIEDASLLIKNKKLELGLDINKTVAAHIQTDNSDGIRRLIELYI